MINRRLAITPTTCLQYFSLVPRQASISYSESEDKGVLKHLTGNVFIVHL